MSDTETTSCCSETQAGSGANNPGRCTPAQPVGQATPPAGGASVVETQAARVMAAEDAGASPASIRPAVSNVPDADLMHMTIDNDGKVTIETGAATLRLSAAHSRSLAQFMRDVSPLINHDCRSAA